MNISEVPTTPTGLLPRTIKYGRSFGVGSAFAIGWTPCIGPILSAILTLAASSGTVLHGAALLAVWSAGLGVPFVLTSMAIGPVTRTLRKLGPAMPVIEVLSGALVIIVGVLIFMDEFTIFNQYFGGGADTVVGAEESIAGIQITGPAGFVAAFLAGIFAFISPCCLPLVPAYLGHLVGVTAEAPESASRGLTIRHAFAFVAGFTVIFVALGASIGAAGSLLQDNIAILEKIAGALLVVLGLNLAGVIKIPWLYRTYQIEFPVSVNSTRG
ncbi:MAG: cytochrome c biogenesis protein CcdA [Dehalococcoidia bacterium]